ncbi:two-component system sensor histidine kinase YcbA [Clostridium algifaecis]|uniref:histidine kinase n=1 Tax=Clostridium algifaecis TaxID=1472040 RepID=A0ABS4KP96_9CLOT|nr:sensor histidine kinase [Clostridium algifaecis]MBP2031859.1 two-component system sensor histidine kinase YcbA [Clostridium algifaecis]
MDKNETKNDIFILLIIIISVPLTGELKFYPFHDTFRVSFSTTIFLFSMLWIKKIPIIICGISAGLSVVFFRIMAAFMLQNNFDFYNNFLLNTPAFFYYLTFSFIFYITKINSFQNRPILIGFFAVISDICSCTLEIFIRHFLLKDSILISTLGLISIIAIIRSFFVLGFFNIIKLNEVREKNKQQSEQNKYMLFLISNLYEETFELKKSITYAEDVTTKCYNLYKKLQDCTIDSIDFKNFSEKLLGIAGEIHEIKKDNLRIYSGLSKMMSSENYEDYMYADYIVNIAIDVNKKYALLLKKDIEFKSQVDTSLPKFHVYTLLSVINNLVSNSLEAIKSTGIIKIFFKKIDVNYIEIDVHDTGPGIPKKKIDIIFKPGYTTKYDKSGKPSNGMGLPYIKKLILGLNGTISVNFNNSNETVFKIKLPITSIIKKG